MSSTILLKLGRPLITNSYQIRTNLHFKLYNQIRCAGHAKWQNIRSTKQANDLAKGRLISRYVLLVRRAVISGGMQTDPRLNGKLGDLLSEAQKFSVPKATLERAIARAINVKVKSVNIEIQGPSGCSLIVRCETDNVPMLRRDMKKVCKKFELNLLPDDTIVNMFRSQGFIRTEMKTVDGRDINQDFAEEAAIIANAQEVTMETYGDETSDEPLSQAWVFSTDAETLNPCKGELEKQGLKVTSSELELVPYRSIDFGPAVYEQLENIQRALKEMDQVIEVYHNVAAPQDSE